MLLDDQVVTAELAKLDGWVVVTPEATPVLAREVRLGSFPEAIAFVGEVAEVAEELDHHPDISIRYDRVGFQVHSHSEGGITDLCLELAGRIDILAERRA